MVKDKKQVFTREEKCGLNRRSFITKAGTAALTFSVMKPHLVRAAEANSKIRLGLIGCGGRGTWIAELFKRHGGYEIAAAADFFKDRVDNFGEKLNVKESSRYTGLSCHKRLLEHKDVDAVAIISPPYFHPEQAREAVDSGRHVYIAKPLAVDVPGCKSIARSGEKSTQKKLCFLVDFQTRADQFYCEAVKRVHEGAIGEFTFGESSYHCGRLGAQAKPDGSQEARIRNWVFDKVLSGDIITEQNIHTLDVMSWIMNEPPIHAFGTGGRKVRVDVGDCWDHFALVFRYSNNVGITFSSRQFNGHGSPGGIRNRMFGSKGVIETEYGGNVMIRGENFYRGGKSPGIYEEGAVTNIAAFHENISSGKFDNPTVAKSVRSNLVTILGRTAAYEDRLVTWDEIMKSDVKLDAKLKGLK
jgi:myo-inositol 2-dehydrogenase/D-chiro-inositol 1-dehydrogenase